MDRENDGTRTQDRQSRAEHALRGYRERRRHRRGEDTYFGSTECLLTHAEEGITDAERSRRRSEILGDAERDGMPRDLAERLYEIAQEEGIDPALGYELVRCGLGVAPPPEGISNAADQPVADKYLPEWMFPPTPPDTVLRERMLRFSLRRLRGLLEEHADAETAIRAFADEPDVGPHGY